jgi:hypothetical protein
MRPRNSFHSYTLRSQSMRKIKLFIASSFDGYIAREDGSVDWLFTDNDCGYLEFYDSIDIVLWAERLTIKLWISKNIPSRAKRITFSAIMPASRLKIKM